jgi:hypothetical protein
MHTEGHQLPTLNGKYSQVSFAKTIQDKIEQENEPHSTLIN